MNQEFCDTILLTGAGFTKNFGGFLANEMWAQIFNDPDTQNSQFIKRMMLEDFDYESIYQKIIKGSSSLPQSENLELEKSTIKNAIWLAYQMMDDIIRIWNPNLYIPDTVNHTKLKELIERFVGDPWEIGFFFTLNQDLFIERWYQYDVKIYLPWVESTPKRAQLAAGSLLDQDALGYPLKAN